MKKKLLLFYICFFQFLLVWSQGSITIQNDAYETTENTILNVSSSQGVLSNDNSTSTTSLEVTIFEINNINFNAGETAVLSQGGLTINSDGSFVFNPGSNFIGNFPIVNYTTSDGSNSNTGNLRLTVVFNESPIAFDDYDTAEINTPLIVQAPGVLENDEDVDSNNLNVTSFSVNGNTFLAGDIATIAQGTIEIRDNGGYTFIPNAGYTGDVTPIIYTISDGNTTAVAVLFLTTERITNLISLESLSSCNQGFGKDGNYHIRYSLRFLNESTARDYHPTNLIRDLNLSLDLDAIYGTGCVVRVDNLSISTDIVENFVEPPYPLEFNSQSINPDFLDGNSSQIFTSNNINNAILYPRQSVGMTFCLVVNPFCGGRPNPTPSGSGIDFDAVFNMTSSIGNDGISLLLTDFHSTEAQVIGDFDVPEPSPIVNPDGTYDFINTVSISNEGNSVARNVNFNMGLGSFLDNGLVFNTLRVTQVSGPPVNVNNNYNGNNNTQLLSPNNNLGAGESIVLEIFHLLAPVGSSAENLYAQMGNSQTQGIADGFNEQNAIVQRNFSFTLWEDNLGAHADRYYNPSSISNSTVDEQCLCTINAMQFSATSSNLVAKTINNRETTPNGILEHEALTYHITVENTSGVVDLDNIQITENLGNLCVNNIIEIGQPEIINSTATVNPTLNTNFDGINDIRLFTGNTGLLRRRERLTVSIRVLYLENCFGDNTVEFTATDPFNTVNAITSSVTVDLFTDSDGDGISNLNDLDDDNDGIPDTIESGGSDPLNDDDNDLTPNYRDTDFGPDLNNDGIIDSFDFDNDGVPNHLDLDADNDGIFDITETANSRFDSDNNGTTNSFVGANGLDDNLETSDSFNANINYVVPNSDTDVLPNYLDIDSDADGVVDNIEAQPTENYNPPVAAINNNGVIQNYLNGLNPVDTEGDGIFDYIDENSDGDIRNDVVEAWDTNSDGNAETLASNTDTDGDGLDDNFDNDLINFNASNNQTPLDFPNVDFASTNERDWRELIAIVVVINDATEIEGNDLVFDIELVTFNNAAVPIVSSTDIELNINSINGMRNDSVFNFAVAPFDFTEVSNSSLVIPALTSSSNFTINSNDDNIYENDELFTLNATIVTSNTINSDINAQGTIIDNEMPPDFDFNNATANEGDDLIFSLILSRPSSKPTNFIVTTINNTAIAPDDYNSITTEITINGTTDPNNANVQGDFSVTTIEDNLNEIDQETLGVRAQNTSNNTNRSSQTRNGTIIDIDPLPLIVINNAEVTEGGTLSYDISLVNQNGELMLNYKPINLTIESADSSTTASLDYQAVQKITTLPAMTSSINQNVITINDNLNEDTETLNLVVMFDENEVSNTTSEIVGLGLIRDDDIPNLFSPNGDGLSDLFRIAGLEAFPNFELQIMDRWGNVVFDYQNNGRNTPLWWDGKYNDQQAKEGVYYYILNFNSPSTPIKTGFIQLAR